MWLALMSYLVLIKKPGTTVKKEAGIKSNNSAFSDLSVAEWMGFFGILQMHWTRATEYYAQILYGIPIR